MQSLAAVLVIPTWPSLVMAVVLLLLLLWIGYKRAPHIFGFGSYVVKKTESFEYAAEEAKKHAPEEEGQPDKRSVTTETQSARTVWEWLTVLIISAVIAGVALWFSNSQAEEQQKLQVQQANDDALQAYLDQMTQMMLDKKTPLLASDPRSAAGMTARVRTVTALKTLDHKNNKIVMSFLRESSLVKSDVSGEKEKESVLRLDKAELDGVELENNSLPWVDLHFALLRGADLRHTNLSLTKLSFANLHGAHLEDADLRNTDLRFANLADAHLKGANFIGANLLGADLKGADLTNTNLIQDQINQAGAGDLHTELPKGIERPNWWTNNPNTIVSEQVEVPRLRYSRLGVSAVAFKSINPKKREELGIPEKVAPLKSSGGPYGILVYDVRPGSSGQDAGVTPGDIIIGVGHRKVWGLADFQNELNQHHYAPDAHFTLQMWHYYFPQGWTLVTLHGYFGD
jgi:uncharacterized protein YjbI with pentapeptide repeats